MGLGLLIWAALVFSLIAEPTLQIKLNNAGRGRNRNNAGGRHRTSSGLGVQIGRGRGIQIGRAGGGGRSSSRGDGDGGGGGGGGGGGLSVGGVFGGNNEDIRSRRPPRPPSDDYDETERETAGAQNSDRLKVSVAVVLPYSVFKKKSYTKKIIQAATALTGSPFMSKYDLSPHLEMLQPIPAPTEVLDKICDHFLANHTAIVLYMTDSLNYGRHTMASQYFLQLAQYVQLPVISWNADNSAFVEQSAGSGDRLQMQLAPTIKHQVAAMLTLLQRYSWNYFSIVTGMIAGHRNFEQTVREMVSDSASMGHSSKAVMDSVVVNNASEDLAPLARTDARVFLLYSTHEEAKHILREATELGLTGKAYVWIATQSAVGNGIRGDAPDEFPAGMLGVHFATDPTTMQSNIGTAMSVLGQALDTLAGDETMTEAEKRETLRPDVSCQDSGEVKWKQGEVLYRVLRNVSVDMKDGQPPIEFNMDGSTKKAELKIVNLQTTRTTSSFSIDGKLQVRKRWEEIGVWKSWGEQSKKRGGEKKEGKVTSPPGGASGQRGSETNRDRMSGGFLDIKDIVWPGEALKPPEGLPEKRFIRASFLEEDPYVMLGPPSTCDSTKGVLCYMADPATLAPGLNITEEAAKLNSSVLRCCSGFCVDLLNKFSRDLSFDFHMVRVKDGKWGGVENGKWNGLVAELINKEADIVMTSVKINSGREKVIDFSVPFLETGITILVAKRTGIISPTAFLEPFDTYSWMLIMLVAVQVAAGSIFFFEWISPSGYDMTVEHHPKSRFSLARTYWLVVAVIFQAAVNVDCPRGQTAVLMAHFWAAFTLILLAIYTANLAAFMITREEFPNLVGLEDRRLTNPRSVKPPFRFGTIPNGATDYVLKNNFPEMHAYMKYYNRSTVKEGFKAVKHDELNAFIYDATVLEYLVGQDDECNILTVGSWYAMTGYGVGFPKGSKWIPAFNKHLMRYRENGDLERMQRFWFTGACEPRKRRRTSSKPLALAQFTSAFLLLGIGIIFSGVLLLCERGYIAYLRPQLLKATANSPSRLNWCSLFSVSVSNSLKRGAKKDYTPEEEGKSEGSDMCDWRCGGGGGGDDDGDADCQEKVKSAKRELEAARTRIAALEHQLMMAANSKAKMSLSFSAPLTDRDDAMQHVSPPSYQRTATQPRCRRHHKHRMAAVATENGQRHVVAHGARQNGREFETVL